MPMELEGASYRRGWPSIPLSGVRDTQWEAERLHLWVRRSNLTLRRKEHDMGTHWRRLPPSD